jgi:hypothetical protein
LLLVRQTQLFRSGHVLASLVRNCKAYHLVSLAEYNIGKGKVIPVQAVEALRVARG